MTGYRYHSTKKHAVTSATINDGSGAVGHTLTYDANGAITQYNRSGTNLDRHIQYNAANQPTKIVVGASLTTTNPTAVDEFAYGPDGQRYARKTVWREGGVTKEEHTSYIGNTTFTTYVGDPNLMASYKTRVSGNIMRIRRIAPNLLYNPALPWAESKPFITSNSTEYAHRDHLGSIETVTDERGNRLLQLAFEPFGSRKDSDWTQNIDATDLAAVLSNTLASAHVRVARGFTGHEHLDKTGFIHMNGRVYDPVLGRFLSPDPIVQAPGNSQSWNRYSYVLNSPMNLTDPSGFAWLRICQDYTTGYESEDGEYSEEQSGTYCRSIWVPDGPGVGLDHSDDRFVPGSGVGNRNRNANPESESEPELQPEESPCAQEDAQEDSSGATSRLIRYRDDLVVYELRVGSTTPQTVSPPNKDIKLPRVLNRPANVKDAYDLITFQVPYELVQTRYELFINQEFVTKYNHPVHGVINVGYFENVGEPFRGRALDSRVVGQTGASVFSRVSIYVPPNRRIDRGVDTGDIWNNTAWPNR